MMTLNDIYVIIEQELKKVEDGLQAELAIEYRLISEVLRGSLAAGGKRLRPALVLLSAKALDYTEPEVIQLACVLEMIHMAILIHDDVIDDSDIRRGKLTANYRWNNKIAILAGDYLLARVFSILNRSADKSVAKLVSEAANLVCVGEIVQSVNRGNVDLSEEVCLTIIENKTASLMSACCQIGAILGSAEEAVVADLGQYGLAIGMAFQIVDDLLDLVGSQDKTGKPVGSDIRQGTVTLPMVYTLQKAEPSERKQLRQAIACPEVSDLDMERVISIVKKYNAIDYCLEVARGYITRAQKHLRALKQSEAKAALKALASYVIEREY